ncbi:putative mitochondrial import inner membrane translocase subunit Tim21 [Apostichopus japonicus]|uniref:Mitochondrial import inner membrane translocase subunit Tim21 n=1 Tax=Stichopus japonicus TaxID=307972 RepID=A0A2G8K259_STIJA|nr:putative mitochondrial import inner membrane translocase subunit Tim21 [Apostichopus japonicus]
MAVLQPLSSTAKFRLVYRMLPMTSSLLKFDSGSSLRLLFFLNHHSFHTHLNSGFKNGQRSNCCFSKLERKCAIERTSVEALWSCCTRSLATKPKTSIQEVKSTKEGEITVAKKVAQAGKDVTYLGVIIVGLGITALMFFTVGKELFSSKSPNVVYTRALKLCKKNDEVTAVFGLPFKGYGEMTRRKRRRHVSHYVYEKDGVVHMRVKFYIEGPDKKGTVNCEVRENEYGQYEYRYLFVEVDGYPPQTIVLEDNR